VLERVQHPLLAILGFERIATCVGVSSHIRQDRRRVHARANRAFGIAERKVTAFELASERIEVKDKDHIDSS
jgi:hypothetical protein